MFFNRFSGFKVDQTAEAVLPFWTPTAPRWSKGVIEQILKTPPLFSFLQMRLFRISGPFRIDTSARPAKS